MRPIISSAAKRSSRNEHRPIRRIAKDLGVGVGTAYHSRAEPSRTGVHLQSVGIDDCAMVTPAGLAVDKQVVAAVAADVPERYGRGSSRGSVLSQFTSARRSESSWRPSRQI
jgi:hypothetical protein